MAIPDHRIVRRTPKPQGGACGSDNARKPMPGEFLHRRMAASARQAIGWSEVSQPGETELLQKGPRVHRRQGRASPPTNVASYATTAFTCLGQDPFVTGFSPQKSLGRSPSFEIKLICFRIRPTGGAGQGLTEGGMKVLLSICLIATIGMSASAEARSFDTRT